MIEKLYYGWQAGGGYAEPAREIVYDKINELVDAVNDITDWIKRTDETIVKYGIKPIPEKIAQGFNNLQDPYAEQRKWVGKLCRFYWGQGCYYGILTNIKRKAVELRYESNGRAFRTCEPVKPDDDIIYKGGDNEKLY